MATLFPDRPQRNDPVSLPSVPWLPQRIIRVCLLCGWQPGGTSFGQIATGTAGSSAFGVAVNEAQVPLADPAGLLSATLAAGDYVAVWQPADANDGHYEPFAATGLGIFCRLNGDLPWCGSAQAEILKTLSGCGIDDTHQEITLYDAFGMVAGSLLANDLNPLDLYIPANSTAFVIPLGAQGKIGSGDSGSGDPCLNVCPPCAAPSSGSDQCNGSSAPCQLYQPIAFGAPCPTCQSGGSGGSSGSFGSSGSGPPGSSGSGPPPGSGACPGPCEPCGSGGGTPGWVTFNDCDGNPHCYWGT